MKSLTKVELDALLAATPEPDKLLFLTCLSIYGLRVSELSKFGRFQYRR